MTTETPSTTRPGGRSARVRAAVHRAVVDLLTEQPADGLTIPAVAQRAGVHPTTVYRRWGSIAELIAAVASSRFTGDLVVPDTGSLRSDLQQWAAEVATDLNDPDSLAILRAGVGSGPPGTSHNCVADREAQIAAMIERERARGHATPDATATTERLLGPIYYRALFQGGVDPAWAQRLVTELD
ncbi:TetR/AcrR family transcriptional regulator [Spongisporangium articulatum]|uniref:TetR/AcrR family transcriptional regulator n=1 Tax=Spongisporangium articulatum TaxID=3362603 RepID=A0ABW8AJJ6_9ACTN